MTTEPNVDIVDTDPQAHINDRERHAKLTWDLRSPGETDGDRETEAVTRLTVSHSKDHKAFLVMVRRIDISKAEPGSPFTIERWAPMGGTSLRLPTIPVARFSRKAFDEAIDASLAELRARKNDPDVVAVFDPTSNASL